MPARLCSEVVTINWEGDSASSLIGPAQRGGGGSLATSLHVANTRVAEAWWPLGISCPSALLKASRGGVAERNIIFSCVLVLQEDGFWGRRKGVSW